MSGFTIEVLRSFHKIDRDLYTRIVKNLCRDAIECLQVIAFWFWLEQIGYPNIILKMLTLPDTVVNAVIDEAILCLNNLEREPLQTLTDHNNMRVTERLMDQPISFQIIYQMKHLAVSGITKMVHDVCLNAFDDIAQEALAAKAAAEEEETVDTHDQNVQDDHHQLGVVEAPHQPAVSMFGHGLFNLFRPMFQIPAIAVPATHQPQAFHGVNPQQHLLEQNEAGPSTGTSTSSTLLNPQAQPWSPNQAAVAIPPNQPAAVIPPNQPAVVVPPNDRTMFVTFSRGYPMTEAEVIQFFTNSYGDVIESMHMQAVRANTQPLFARMVLLNAASIGEILNGREKAKFVINGKHVWVRRYVANE